MAWAYAAATRDFFDEFGRDIIIEIVNQSAPLIKGDPKYLRKGDKSPRVLKFKNRPTMTGTVEPSLGGYASGGMQADGGNYPTADEPSTPGKGYYSAAIFTMRPKFPVSAMRIGKGGNGWNVLKTGLEKAARQSVRLEERAYIGAKLGTVAVSVLAGVSAFTMTDIGGLRAGDSIECFNAAVFVERATIASITVAASGASTVTLSAALAQNWTAGFFIYLRVGADVNNATKGFVDCTDSSGGMYSNLTNAQFPAGELDTTTTAWSNTTAGALNDRASFKYGGSPTHLIVSPFTRRFVYNGQNANLRFIEGTIDVYGNALTFDGIPLVQTPNQGRSIVDAVVADEMEVHQAYDWGMDTDGNGHEGFGAGGLQLSENGYYYIAPISKAANLRVENRVGFWRQSALTS